MCYQRPEFSALFCIFLYSKAFWLIFPSVQKKVSASLYSSILFQAHFWRAGCHTWTFSLCKPFPCQGGCPSWAPSNLHPQTPAQTQPGAAGPLGNVRPAYADVHMHKKPSVPSVQPIHCSNPFLSHARLHWLHGQPCSSSPCLQTLAAFPWEGQQSTAQCLWNKPPSCQRHPKAGMVMHCCCLCSSAGQSTGKLQDPTTVI